MKNAGFFILIFSCGWLAACNSNTNNQTVRDSKDSGMVKNIDSSQSSPTITDSAKLRILTLKGKNMSYPEYKASFEEDVASMKPSFTLDDIDGDGNKEIVVAYYTGGAHCCDVTTILTKAGENEMKEVMDYTGGTTIAKDTVVLSFSEALGYFHTCYACGIDYPGNIDPTVSLVFGRGGFTFSPGNSKANDDIIKNMAFITSKPIPDKDAEDAGGMDDGTRKAIAFNIVAYYYNNNRQSDAAKKLFDQYYQHRDKADVWADIAKYISNFDEEISKSVFMNALSR